MIEPFEGARARPGCLLWPARPCRDSRACAAHGAWGSVKTAYARFLEASTIADLQGGAEAAGAEGRASRGGNARPGRRRAR